MRGIPISRSLGAPKNWLGANAGWDVPRKAGADGTSEF